MCRLIYSYSWSPLLVYTPFPDQIQSLEIIFIHHLAAYLYCKFTMQSVRLLLSVGAGLLGLLSVGWHANSLTA